MMLPGAAAAGSAPTLLAVLEEIALLALPPLDVLPMALEKLLGDRCYLQDRRRRLRRRF